MVAVIVESTLDEVSVKHVQSTCMYLANCSVTQADQSKLKSAEKRCGTEGEREC